MNKNGNARGITLIALVITIVLMLILVGIALNLSMGENGILEKAIKAKKDDTDAHEKELADLEELYSEILVATNDDTKITISMENLNTLIEAKVNEAMKVSIPSPNYESRQMINFTNESYVVEKDGYIQMFFYYNTSMQQTSDALYINNVLVFVNRSPDVWQNAYSPIFSVKKGDVVSYYNMCQEVTGYYYPIRY